MYISEHGISTPANARFNRKTGQIDVDNALLNAANTPAGAANLFMALSEENAEWVLHSTQIDLGQNIDHGAAVGFSSILNGMSALAGDGKKSFRYSLSIDGVSNSYATDIGSMFDSLGDTFSSSRMFANIQDADSAYQIRGTRNVRPPLQGAVNGRAVNIMDVLSNADALGLIPDSYRDSNRSVPC